MVPVPVVQISCFTHIHPSLRSPSPGFSLSVHFRITSFISATSIMVHHIFSFSHLGPSLRPASSSAFNLIPPSTPHVQLRLYQDETGTSCSPNCSVTSLSYGWECGNLHFYLCSMGLNDHYITCRQVSRSQMGKHLEPGESVEHIIFDEFRMSLRVG